MSKKRTPAVILGRFRQYARIIKIRWTTLSDGLQSFLNNQNINTIEGILHSTVITTVPKNGEDKLFFLQTTDDFIEMDHCHATELINVQQKLFTNQYRLNRQYHVMKYIRKKKLSYEERRKVCAISLFSFLVKEVRRIIRDLLPASICRESFSGGDRRRKPKSSRSAYRSMGFRIRWKQYNRAA